MNPETLFTGKSPKDSAYIAEFLAAIIRRGEAHLLPDESGAAAETLLSSDLEFGLQPAPTEPIRDLIERLKVIEQRERKKAADYYASLGPDSP